MQIIPMKSVKNSITLTELEFGESEQLHYWWLNKCGSTVTAVVDIEVLKLRLSCLDDCVL